MGLGSEEGYEGQEHALAFHLGLQLEVLIKRHDLHVLFESLSARF